MKRTILYGLPTLLGLWFALNGCEQEGIMQYEGGAGLFFTAHAQDLSFMAKLNAEKDTMAVYVHLMGNPVDYDRPISVEVVNDTNTTATPEQYRVLEGAKVLANDTCGWVRVEVKNPDLLNISTKMLSLRIRLVENEYFKIGGFLTYDVIKLTWTMDIVQPQTWNAIQVFCTRTYSSNAYRAVIASTGLLEFWYFYYDPVTGYRMDQYEASVYGKQFSDWIREYNATHDDVYRHDDGPAAGTQVIPIY
ncbi:MAG: DUF4843 domain-containing protein [Odoribacteraceae bacterium]|nr:DUF4843 domain-containing protein [Odoribacteraceae bacterium]